MSLIRHETLACDGKKRVYCSSINIPAKIVKHAFAVRITK